MKQFVVVGVVVMLAMLLGGVMLAENVFLGPMASLDPVPTETESTVEKVIYLEEETKEAEKPADSRRFAGYSGFNAVGTKGDKE
ncbi:hypothetical protein FACS1894109_08950 [Spirochaetia bacterium]|nr:hypothetical protein FACS1894109_08950 [Spirochaetia bacterium]GHU15619.1 hypothetical protein FACS1894163_03020 [Spirochaetia bacterium]